MHSYDIPLIQELNNQFRLTLYSEQIEEIVVNSWGEMLLEYLRKENAISAKSAMKLWEVSARTTRIRLKQLQDEGIIVRIGTSENDPSSFYVAARHLL